MGGHSRREGPAWGPGSSSQTRLLFPWPVPCSVAVAGGRWEAGTVGGRVLATPAPSVGSWRQEALQKAHGCGRPGGCRPASPAAAEATFPSPGPRPLEGKRPPQDGLLTTPGPFLLSLLPSNQSLPLVPSLCDLWFRPFVTSGSETRQPVCRPSRDSSPSPRVRVRGRDFFVRKGSLRTREGRSLPRPTVAHNRWRHNGAVQGRPDPRFLHRQGLAEARLTLPLLSEEVAVKGRGLWPVVLGSEQG